MKKAYQKPQVESGSSLEQTSLACNLHTEPPYGFGEECFRTQPDPTNYAKNGNWNRDVECDNILAYPRGGCGPGGHGEDRPGRDGIGVLFS